VILTHKGSHAQAGQFIDGRHGPLWVSCCVSDKEFEGWSVDPSGVIDFADGLFEASEQVAPCLDPAGPGKRNKSADLDR
jgi:hypothetical protein